MADETPETHSLLKSFLLGGVLPLVFVLAGIGAYLAMGKIEPKKVIDDENDLAVRLKRLPTVIIEKTLLFDQDRKLDLDVTGVVVPFRQITLAAEVSGRVAFKSEACRIGRFVDEGDILFQLDATDYQMEVDRLTALRESEYAQQKELNQEVANAQRSMELADQEVDLQEKELKRLQQLPSGFASATELDQARRGLLVASNQRLNLQNQLEMLDTKRTRITLAERLASTQLSMAKVNLGRTEIRAPLSGVIVSENVEQASFIQKGATLCVIDDTRHVEVSCNLRADQLMLILGQEDDQADDQQNVRESYELPATPVTVEFRVAGRQDNVFQWEGVVSRYEGIGLDPKSRTIPIRIVVDNPRAILLNGQPLKQTTAAPPALVQGMFIDCHIHIRPDRKLVMIPELALRPGNQVWEFLPKDTSSSEEWLIGDVRLIKSIKPIRLVREKVGEETTDFWLCEPPDHWTGETQLIVSPVAGFSGDGSDQAKVERLKISS
jgi:multidrug efflux pump subunit AcrA (membrane-fusion protein)